MSMLPLRILLPYATPRDFLARYGEHVSKEGMFVSTSALQPVGTQLAFEMVLSTGAMFLKGVGTVERADAGALGQRGMYIRFLQLDASSRFFLEQRLHVELSLVQEKPDDSVVGIDFGTEACRGAVIRHGQLQKLPQVESCVWLGEDRELIVGSQAAYAFRAEPQHGLWGPKRLLGLRVKSPGAKKWAERLSCPLRTDSQWNVSVQLRNLRFSATQLAAAILVEFKHEAEKHLGKPLHQVVLAVPNAFTERQRSAMLEAAELAGLHVLQLVNETTACALAFGHGRGLPRKRILVADWGSDSFSASVCELVGNELEVVSAGGQNLMGGMEVDWLLSQALLRRLPNAPSASPTDTVLDVRRFLFASRLAKHALSLEPSIDVQTPYGQFGQDNESLRVRHHVTLTDLEKAASPLLERAMGVLTDVFESARLTPQSLDEVLLVGGQLKAPWAKHRLEAHLGRASLDAPEHEVASGAALLAHSLLEKREKPLHTSVTEGLTAPIGLQTTQGTLRRLFERNIRLPTRQLLKLNVPKGEPLLLALFQGTSPRAEENTFLGYTFLDDALEETCSLHFQLSSSGTLEVNASVGQKTFSLSPLARNEIPEGIFAHLVSVDSVQRPPMSFSQLLTNVRKWLPQGRSR